jgi:hypothetical protein
MGVLSLAQLNIKFRPDEEVELVVPNLCVRRSYVREFLYFQAGKSGSTTMFLNHPSSKTLQAFLNRFARS